MFPITGVLTILGLGLFLARGEKSLNVDFVGGVVYGGQFAQAGAHRRLVASHEFGERVAVVPNQRARNELCIGNLGGRHQGKVSVGCGMAWASRASRRR